VLILPSRIPAKNFRPRHERNARGVGCNLSEAVHVQSISTVILQSGIFLFWSCSFYLKAERSAIGARRKARKLKNLNNRSVSRPTSRSKHSTEETFVDSDKLQEGRKKKPAQASRQALSVLEVRKVLSGSGRAIGLSLMGKNIRHLLVARPEPYNTFRTGSTFASVHDVDIFIE